ncbi:MAG: D-2-hydroxyacid dehydrogenase [Candidatus Marinimicrobia bacterium]|nr:D-2-hydroxyacid dehydrogenase [Candidatus Neomarinimicrobiota bacterium]
MKRVKTLITMVTPTPRIEALLAEFEPRAEIHFLREGEQVADYLEDLEVLYGTLRREEFCRAKRLRWVQTNSTGVEHVMYPEFRASRIILTNTGNSIASVVAAHALTLFLALARNLHHQRDLMKRHLWQIVCGRDLGAMTLGIVGFGKIGKALAERAAPLVNQIYALDIRDLEKTPLLADTFKLNRLQDFLIACDGIICTLPLTPESENLFSDREFQLMKKDAYFVNVSRGEIVNEAALLRALREGEIAGAALDVLAAEPCPADSPLWDEPNLLLTPHSAGYCENLEWRKMRQFAENFRHYLDTRTIPGAIDKERGW